MTPTLIRPPSSSSDASNKMNEDHSRHFPQTQAKTGSSKPTSNRPEELQNRASQQSQEFNAFPAGSRIRQQGPQAFRPSPPVQNDQRVQTAMLPPMVVPRSFSGEVEKPKAKPPTLDVHPPPAFGGFGSGTRSQSLQQMPRAPPQNVQQDYDYPAEPPTRGQSTADVPEAIYRDGYLDASQGYHLSPRREHHAQGAQVDIYHSEHRYPQHTQSRRGDPRNERDLPPPSGVVDTKLESTNIPSQSIKLAPSKLRNSYTLPPSPWAESFSPNRYDQYGVAAPHGRSEMGGEAADRYQDAYSGKSDIPSTASEANKVAHNTVPPPFDIPRMFSTHVKLVNNLDLNTIMSVREKAARSFASDRSWEEVKDLISKQEKANTSIMRNYGEIQKKLNALRNVKDATLEKTQNKTECYNDAGKELSETTLGLHHKMTHISSAKRRKLTKKNGSRDASVPTD